MSRGSDSGFPAAPQCPPPQNQRRVCVSNQYLRPRWAIKVWGQFGLRPGWRLMYPCLIPNQNSSNHYLSYHMSDSPCCLTMAVTQYLSTSIPNATNAPNNVPVSIHYPIEQYSGIRNRASMYHHTRPLTATNISNHYQGPLHPSYRAGGGRRCGAVPDLRPLNPVSDL
jgi:hypothetical protein